MESKFGVEGSTNLHSRKLTWKPEKGPIKTTVPLKGGYMGFHVSLGECSFMACPKQEKALTRRAQQQRWQSMYYSSFHVLFHYSLYNPI